MRIAHITLALLLPVIHECNAQAAPDDARAVARMDAMLENVGGRQKWAAARTLYVKEHAFLKSGEQAVVEIWRDFERLTRHLRVSSPSREYVEVISERAGWSRNNGSVTRMAAAELSEQRQGLRQEPYYVYHRLAKRDPVMTVRLEGTDRLNVYESGKLTCWFVLDGKDRPISWGNHFKGAVNQHWYGPLVPIGPVFLPRWGAAADGRWRFEYLDAALSTDPLELPAEPQ
jgi:hypothetical protein